MDRPSKRVKTDTEDTNGNDNGNGKTSHDSAQDKKTGTDVMQDLYLETVDRSQLDFDQEKLCCVTLGNTNIYACLVCGKYYSGRSKSTPAFFHALNDDHHVFLNLDTLGTYILPDGYVNNHPALADIKDAVSPHYTPQQVSRLDQDVVECRDVAKSKYRPGFVGLNNVKGQAHVVVLIHALAHVKTIRDHVLLHEPPSNEVSAAFTLIMRKMWSGKLLRAHLNPATFVRHFNALQFARAGPAGSAGLGSGSSAKKLLEVTTTLLGFLHRHHRDLRNAFQGVLEIDSQLVTASEISSRTRFDKSSQVTTTTSKFQHLVLHVPPAPLFINQVAGTTVIPQVSLMDLLGVYDGVQVQELPGSRKRYRLIQTGTYLLLHFPRFAKGDVTGRGNPTIVSFPLRGLDLSSLIHEPTIPPKPDTSKHQAQSRQKGTQRQKQEEEEGSAGSAVYDLLVNVTHERSDGEDDGDRDIYKCQVRDKASDCWMAIDGLLVREIKRDMINVGAPTVMQIWERRST